MVYNRLYQLKLKIMAKAPIEIDEKQIAVMQEKVSTTSDVIMKMTIKDDRDMATASELLSKITSHSKEIKADKEKLTKPLNAVLLEIRKKYKPVETELEKADKHLRKEIGAYQTRKDDEAEAERIRIAGRVGIGKGKLKIETAAKQMAEVEAPDRKVVTDSGSISFKEDYEITIVDLRKIPEQFLSVDEVSIRKVFKAGGTVDGVVAKKIKVPINRTA
jgi:protein-tyrosine-phosphatase